MWLPLGARNSPCYKGVTGPPIWASTTCAMPKQFTELSPLDCLRTKFPSLGACGWRAERWASMQTGEWLGVQYEQGTPLPRLAMEEMEENGLRKQDSSEDWQGSVQCRVNK